MNEIIEGTVVAPEAGPLVPVYETKIATFSNTAVLLAQMTAMYAGRIYDVTTTEGMEDAREARRTIREVRYALEEFRKQEKADILERGRMIDTDAKALKERLEAIENPIHEQIKAEEDRKAAEKAERERVEKLRVDGIRAKIDAIRNLPAQALGKTSAELRAMVEELDKRTVTKEEFEEFAVEADEVRGSVVLALARALGAAELLEQQQADLKRQQDELAQAQAQAREDAARNKREREELERSKTPEPTVAPFAGPTEAALAEEYAKSPRDITLHTITAFAGASVQATLPWAAVPRKDGSCVIASLDDHVVATFPVDNGTADWVCSIVNRFMD